MYKNTRVSMLLAGAMIGSSLSMGMVHAACPTSPNPCPSGTVWINLGDGIDQTIAVSNGEYDIRVNGNLVHGTINMEGNYSIPSLGGTDGVGNITKFPGTTYQLKNTTEVLNVLNGYVSYKGQKIQIGNGRFTLNNITGTIDAAGKIVYNGQALNLFDIPGIEGYQLNGQAFITNPNTGTLASNKDFKAWVNNLPADKGRGNMNYDRGATWQEFNNTTPNASQKQVTAWLKANPGLTPREVFNNMKNYKIHYYAIQSARQELGDSGAAYYSFNMGRFGSVDAGEVKSEVVTTKELYDAGLIDINATGMGRGGFGSLNGIFNGDNVYEAAAAGWLNKGVMYADRYGIPPVSGKTSEDVYFSQKDLNEAKSYRSVGYWGPANSGDMDIEFRKSGRITGSGLNRRYSYTNGMWSNDTPTGPNIADPRVYRYVPTNTNNPTNTGSTGTTGMVGNDRDAHGCIGSAGYSWDATLLKCIRPWEQNNQTANPNITSFTASPTSITTGQSSTIRWTSTNADKCVISYKNNSNNGDDIAYPRATAGSFMISPSTTSTFLIICSKGSFSANPKEVTITVNAGSTTLNPYKSAFSVSAQNKLNAWISAKITVRSNSLTPANYNKFIEAVVVKLNNIKSTTPASSKNKLNTIGYLVYELRQIQNNIDDSDSFLDSLFD